MVDLQNGGGRSDVNFGQVAADEIEPSEEDALLPQEWPDRFYSALVVIG